MTGLVSYRGCIVVDTILLYEKGPAVKLGTSHLISTQAGLTDPRIVDGIETPAAGATSLIVGRFPGVMPPSCHIAGIGSFL